MVPVVQTTIGHYQKGNVVSFWGIKRPISLLAISPSLRVAFAITGEQVPVERLIEEASEIKTVID